MKAVLGMENKVEDMLDQSIKEIGLNESFKLTGKTTPLQMALVNMDGVEEDRDLEGLAIRQKRYQNLFKFLFDKYTSFTPIPGKPGHNFDLLREQIIKV